MKHYFSKVTLQGYNLKEYSLAHKKISAAVLILVVAIFYYFYTRPAPVKTVIQHVKVIQKDLSLTLSASGQVASEQSVDLKAKYSGDVVYVGLVQGDKVNSGKVLVSLDSKDAQKSVRDAELAVKQAQLDLDKAEQPSANADVLAVQSAIKDAEAQKIQNAQAVARAYSTLLNTGLEAVPTNSSYNDASMPTVSGTYMGTSSGSINLSIYQGGDGAHFSASGLVTVLGLVSTNVPQPIGDSGLYIKFAGQYYTSNWSINIPNPKASGYLSALNSYNNAIQSQKDGDAAADRSIAENNEKLKLLDRGTDPLDIQSNELTLEQKQNALIDARQTLSDYSAVAPFSGVAASIPVNKGDSITSGTVLATLISPTQIVQISVNEVDIPKIKIGQKARLTFDAVNDARLMGHVVEIDTIGTVTSGVVTYKVKIAFDTEDDRIKPNMTVNADLLIDSVSQALVVPVSAVKQQRGSSYVEQEVTANGTTTINRIPVTVGLMTDQEAQILTGLNLGDDVIVRKTTQTTRATTGTQAPSLFGSPRLRG